MNRFFNTDSKFFQIMDKFSSIVLLNILWIVCCIPVVTIGAATTALYYVTLKLVRDEESYIVKSYFKSFALNFRQATGIWAMVLVFLGILYFDFSVLNTSESPISHVITILLYVLIFFFIMVMCYVFPLLAKFDNTVFNTVKNSMFLSIIHAPKTFLLLLWTVIPVIALYQFPEFMVPVFVICGISAIAYFKSKIYVKIFDKIIPVENPEEEQVNEGEKEI